jgi:hypothetical protein
MNQVELPEGARVAYRHLRRGGEVSADVPYSKFLDTARSWKEGGFVLYPKGGVTEARILRGDEVLAEGKALCRPDENFNRKLGRNIALGRALKALKAYEWNGAT